MTSLELICRAIAEGTARKAGVEDQATIDDHATQWEQYRYLGKAVENALNNQRRQTNTDFASLVASIANHATGWARDLIIVYPHKTLSPDSVKRYIAEVRGTLEWMEKSLLKDDFVSRANKEQS